MIKKNYFHLKDANREEVPQPALGDSDEPVSFSPIKIQNEYGVLLRYVIIF